MKKLSYTSGTSAEPMLGFTIGEAFEQTVSLYPDNEAVVVKHQNIRKTYRELKEDVDECARAFLAVDVKKGDRVGIWASNCYEWLIVQLATSKIGAILVNINPSYRVHELEYALKQSGCSIVVTAQSTKYSDFVDILYQLVPTLKSDKSVQSTHLPNLRLIISLGDIKNLGMLQWKEMLELAEKISLDQLIEVEQKNNFDDPINIQYTSGTTGFPKGATLSHHSILNNGYFVAENMRVTDKDRAIITVPLYHCFGMVIGNLGCITHGATMIYPGEGFDPELVLRTVEEEKATVLHGVPTMFIAELNHPAFEKYDLRSLRTGIMGGALCPEELMRKVNTLMHMAEVEIAYGMTETSPVSTQTRFDDPFDKRVQTVGRVMPYTEIKIIDPNTGKVLPIGERGELCARGYCVMLGYWNDEGKTKATIDAARWIHSGDIAIMDEKGFISIVGRIKDMIIRGGENIYPKEIEEFIFQHPKVQEVQVIGVPDEKYGEEVCAWIKLCEGETWTVEKVIHYCKNRIAYYKIPKYIKFVEEFPMTITGKIRKVEMREMMEREMEEEH
jgi:fatty-acyl-CoA synthase